MTMPRFGSARAGSSRTWPHLFLRGAAREGFGEAAGERGENGLDARGAESGKKVSEVRRWWRPGAGADGPCEDR